MSGENVYVGSRSFPDGWVATVWWEHDGAPGARRRYFCRLDRYSADGVEVVRTIESGACRTAAAAEEKAIARALRSPA